ncbi:MAG TPA: selenocysteine-specific translation elongation factor [Phycisphaerales bacterium]|nr:selenocysteine-specific translation elongation factor [Phycisphaerales bacterium]
MSFPRRRESRNYELRTNSLMTQINITLGTAGHIDHGKTALIRLLTGCETDRLKAEKQRGMSIELGFAPCLLGDREVGIVDVPGHEHFIKTMVAGAAGIDGVLFVVAANDGIMPQTREHLEILTLLGVRHGLTVLTKIDRVSDERVAAVTDELRMFLCGTFLQDAPICPMSSITGQGFDGFYTALKDVVASICPKSIDGVFRLPVERAFSVKGFGTVLSGIPAAGSAQIGQEVVLLPSGQSGRIKAIQVYGKPSEYVRSGQCAALNIPQMDYRAIRRGDVLTVEGNFSPTQWFLCAAAVLPGQSLPVKNGAEMRFHTGTADVAANVYRVERDEHFADGDILFQIRAHTPLVAAPGDRFILRSLSPMRTVGGGRILQAMSSRLRYAQGQGPAYAKALAEAQRDETTFVAFAVESAASGAARLDDLTSFTKQTPEQVRRRLEDLLHTQTVVTLSDDVYIHARKLLAMHRHIIETLEQFHAEHPERPGMDSAALAEGLELDKGVFEALLEVVLKQGTIVRRLDRLALPSHTETCDPALAKRLRQIETAFLKNLFSPPGVDELTAESRLRPSQIREAITILIEQKKLFRVDRTMMFHAEAVEQAKHRIVEHIQGQGRGRLESVAFKYLIDTTRKYAIPLLDYMDKIGFTRRVGNTRYLK